MNSTLFNWSIKQLWQRTPHARRLRLQSSARLWSHAQVESLELRSLPSITSLFSAGALMVTSDGTDAIVLGVNSSGNATLNGDPLESATGTSLAANSVTSLDILGGPGNNVIDLSDITLAAFATLTQVNVDGGAGNDLIIGSALSDNITSNSGNDTISGGSGNDVINGNVTFNNPLASGNATFTTYSPVTTPQTTMAGSSPTSSGSNLNSGGLANSEAPGSSGTPTSSILHDPAETDPKDLLEEHVLTHFHWQKESLLSRPTINVSNCAALVSTDSRSVLLGLSNSVLSVQTLNRADSKLRTLSGTAESLDSAQDDQEGLIDLNDKGSSKCSKRLCTEIITIESLEDISGTTLIATRVAMPNRRLQMPPTQPANDVPNIFRNQGEGGFIELLAITANQAPQGRTTLKRLRQLKRHDQVDAEIGRFIGFDRQADIVNTSNSQRLVPPHSPQSVDSEPADSTAQVSWGIALSACVGVALWSPRTRTLRVLRIVFRSMQTRHSKTSDTLTPR